MARTNLPLTTALGDSAVGVLYTTTAADQANGMNIALASGAIPAAPEERQLALIINNTGASPFTAIVRAGANPPALRAGQGDMTVTITNATTRVVGPFSSMRFEQSDGSMNLDFGAGFVGTVVAVLVPSRF